MSSFGSMSSQRRRPRAPRCRVVLTLASISTLLAAACLSSAFIETGRLPAAVRTQPVQDDRSMARRELLALGGAGVVAASALAAPSLAADFPTLARQVGPFVRDPKEAVIVGDLNSDEAKNAKAKIIALQTEVEEALARLEKNPQEDLTGMIQPFGIADLREATNIINNLMDENTAAGIQRLQRLMIQAKVRFEDDIPFPVSQKGVVQPRGAKRTERIASAFKEYIKRSTELLEFI
eukprot:CAMPEP_0171110142 /NCGR_PEP_ID=MMETSP0766_2-20121228/71185_1 /TAXON_ID=439317 /ORGANISM="Gambierdiscus australes, Strain CAWD 149" /LENGTH=235 /DNA_ID=CAMNT_0011571979 /DNA_START=28 /DNA_END=735 /DNA_ORIENTATION=-